MKILSRVPDFEGGFITKSLESYQIVTRDNDGNILDSVPYDMIEKGAETDLGTIKDCTEDTVIMTDNRELDRLMVNSHLLNKALETGKLEIDEPEEPFISGTFETVLGKVEVEREPDDIRTVLCSPDKVEEDIFYKSIGNKLYTAEVIKPFIGNHRILWYGSERKKRSPKLYKAFGNSVSLTKPTVSTGNAWNQKGGQKPGHKYIDRKEVAPGKYIYLYKMPDGRKQWQNEQGQSVKQPEGQAAEPDMNFTKGDIVKFNGENYAVKEAADNLLVLAGEGKKPIIVNKTNYLQEQRDLQNFRQGDIVSFQGKSSRVKLTTNNFVLMEYEDGGHKLFRKNVELKKVSQGEMRTPETFKQYGIDKKVADVTSGIVTLDEYLMQNHNYKDDPEYKLFLQTSQETGFGRKNDLRQQKFVKTPQGHLSVERRYNPINDDIEISIDGIDNYPVYMNGKKFIAVDAMEDGYIVKDKQGEYFHLPFDELEKERQKELEVQEKKKLKFSFDDKGNIASSEWVKEDENPDMLAKLKQANKDKAEERPKLSIRSKTKTAPVQSQEDKDRVKLEYERTIAEKKQTLDTPAYVTFRQDAENEGFKVMPDLFTAEQTAKVNGVDYKFVRKFDYKTGEVITEQTSGKYNQVEINGKKYDIEGIKGNKVLYKDSEDDFNNSFLDTLGVSSIKSISLDELKEMNGEALFAKTEANKGLVSTKKQTKQLSIDSQTKIPYWTEVVEADQITPSHTYNNGEFVKNNNYSIKAAQNRDYNAKDIEVTEGIKNKPDFDMLDDVHLATSGAPIVNNNYEVYGGNNRSMGIIAHYSSGGNKYKEDLINHAEELGFNPDEIKSMKNPILIRRTDVSAEEANVLGGKTNQSLAKEQSLDDTARAKVQQIKRDENLVNQIHDLFAKVKDPEIDTFNKYIDSDKGIGDEIFNLLRRKDIINANEIRKYTNNNGKPNKEVLKSLMRNLIFGDTGEYFENNLIPENTVKALDMSLGTLMGLTKEQSLQEPINSAIKIIGKYQNYKDKYNNIDEYLNSDIDIFSGSEKVSDKTKAMIKLLEGKPTEVKNKINSYRADMESNMFSDGLSPEEAFKNNFQ